MKLIDRIKIIPPHRPPYVIEDSDHLPLQVLFSFLNVDWVLSPLWWMGPLWMLAIGGLISFLGTPTASLQHKLLYALGYAVVIEFSMIIHQAAQAIASVLVHAPMKAVVFTATFSYQIYEDKQEYPSRVHIIRALTGPGINFFVAILAVIVYFNFWHNPLILFTIIINGMASIVPLAPVPTMDGGAILHELRNWRDG